MTRTAKTGIKEHGEELVKMAGWFAERHQRYTRFVGDIFTHLVEGSKIKKDLAEEKVAKEGKLAKVFGGKGRKESAKTSKYKVKEIDESKREDVTWRVIERMKLVKGARGDGGV